MSVLNHRAQYVSFSRITKTGTAIERLGGRHRETERETERDRKTVFEAYNFPGFSNLIGIIITL